MQSRETAVLLSEAGGEGEAWPVHARAKGELEADVAKVREEEHHGRGRDELHQLDEAGHRSVRFAIVFWRE